MARRKLRLIIHIGPIGFDEIDPPRMYFTDKKEDPYIFTRGEGQAMRFVLEDGDYSPNFYEALADGQLLEFLQSKWWKLTWEDKEIGNES